MVKFAKGLLLVLILSVLLAACSAPAPRAIPTAAGAVQQPAGANQQSTPGYPAVEQGAAPSQAYPASAAAAQDPNSLYPKSVDVPKPKDGLGVITGKVVEKGTNQVYMAPSLILGDLVFSDKPDVPPLVGFSQDTDPKGVQDQSGKFVFKDIKPGKYAIVVWTPSSQTLISDNKGNTLQVTVEAGKVSDLGDVYVP